ncbi:unnamed protein product [Effrenium voratum]|nr:unnamed protein product [Effrenium voratum]
METTSLALYHSAGRGLNAVVANSALGGLSACGQWLGTLDMFQSLAAAREMMDDTTSLNCGLSALTRAAIGSEDPWQRAMELLSKARDGIGLQPDVVSLRNAVLACRDLDWRWALHWLEAARAWTQPDAISYSSAISAAEQAARWEVALALMRDAPVQPDLIMLNAVISACEKGQQWERALEVFDEAGTLKLNPDIVTFGAVACACERGAAWRRATELLARLPDLGLRADTVMCNAVISALQTKGTCWQQALDLLGTMKLQGPTPDAVSFTAAMSACEKASGWQLTLQLLDELLRLKQAARAQMAFNVCISACERSRRVEPAMRLLAEMERQDLEPDQISFNSALRACERCLAWQRALALAIEFGGGMDAAGLAAVANACQGIHGQLPPLLQRTERAALWWAEEAGKFSLDGSAMAGDLLLLFTDGLTDNLHWHEVVRAVDEVVERLPGGRVPPQEIAQALAEKAEKRSHDTKANTPFAQSARRNRLHFPGGKEDDITVVAAWIQNEEAGSSEMDVTMGTLEKASATKTCAMSTSG